MTARTFVAPGSGEMFDAIAPGYDRMNRILSLGIDRRWRRATTEALHLMGGERVLDVATGTADLALDLARHHPSVTVEGVDPSGEMLAIGRRKIEAAGLSGRVRLTRGDAQALAYEDDSFDAATIAFGIRNVPDRDRGLAEMARVTRPGGCIAVLELSAPGRGWRTRLARAWMTHAVPLLGALLSSPRAYRYLRTSIVDFPSPAQFATQLERASLIVEEVRPLTFGSAHLFVCRVPG